ncbi:hypothetical protein SEA_CLOWN_19 [Gordonia phage Clown]|uniref:Uncharacterized protein n=1 Tax=Gordonia phage Clown TaxID=2759393 RepID=A0A7L7SPD5_9CAUD|nr:hypothetical protein KNV25_gp19 [Gordonia phage Clown]QOC56017.1 hypothetical protein SEA_CLOWN_19 [Gordonia phage Clown]
MTITHTTTYPARNFPTTTLELRTTSSFDRTERRMWEAEHKAGRITDEEWLTYREYYTIHNPRQY